MVVGEAPYIETELTYLQASPSWPKWREAICEVPHSPATRLSYYPRSSGNLIHQAYHLARWEERTGLDVATLRRIVEFGGGYGAMAQVCRQAGFRGEYYIYDFPELLLFQKFYLSMIGLNAHRRTVIKTVSGFPAWEKTIWWYRKHRADLLVALWSLSETDRGTQGAIMDSAAPDYILFGSARDESFVNFMMAHRRWTWEESIIFHHDPGEHVYLYGKTTEKIKRKPRKRWGVHTSWHPTVYRY